MLRKGERYAAVFAEAGPLDGPHLLSGLGVPLVLLTTVHRPLNNSTLAAAGAAAQLRRPVRQDHLAEILVSLANDTLSNPTPSAAPLAAAAPAVARNASAAARAAPADAGRSADATSVLVVDDVELNLVVAKAMLASLGVAVRTAAGGEEALKVLSRERVDLVLMDCHMPGVDGYEVTRRVRASPGPNRDTPIVALSASAFADDKDRAMASGMNDFATKPIELSALRALLDRWTQEVRA